MRAVLAAAAPSLSNGFYNLMSVIPFPSFPTRLPSLDAPQDVGLYTDQINQIIRYINTIVYGSNVPTSVLLKANNLSDVDDVAAARTNLGLGSAATQSSTAFDTHGAAAAVLATSLQKSSNLSDLVSTATARTNLGLGSAATQNSSAFDPAGSAASKASQGINGDITALTALSVKTISTGNYKIQRGDQYIVVLATTAAKTISYTSTANTGQVRIIKSDATYNPVNISDGTTGPLLFSLVAPASNGYCQAVTVLKSTGGLKCF